MINFIGFIATLFVFISFIPKNIKVIRILNLIGSVFFVIYGFSVGAFWTGVMNAGLILVHCYHLEKIRRQE